MRYRPGEECRPHFDAYSFSAMRQLKVQRVKTAIIYLNDCFEGGKTCFPRLKLEVEPERGKLISFRNVEERSMELLPLSLHSGAPIKNGAKYILTCWFQRQL
ncbi:2OG-Fe(II) oxygenase [Simiduia sp. 21SJ11W-1]|uniref:2OG-Fe(II) oxygenase n=1 Tax=Simiduia sp. 21SJ11W-1 TaxID=2909669 RepID=UPI00209E6483|nr:2OG-Fe(II) oxygenase [Simiduia sp. 21SJ11W-1]UTA49626.1 2OG-Fe(II) oxygenase [Simiduia sp. 21SJ11W-1]